MADAPSMQIRQSSQNLSGNGLDPTGIKMILLLSHQVPKITVHQIQAEVDDGRFMGVPMGALEDHIVYGEDIDMLQMLQ